MGFGSKNEEGGVHGGIWGLGGGGKGSQGKGGKKTIYITNSKQA